MPEQSTAGQALFRLSPGCDLKGPGKNLGLPEFFCPWPGCWFAWKSSRWALKASPVLLCINAHILVSPRSLSSWVEWRRGSRDPNPCLPSSPLPLVSSPVVAAEISFCQQHSLSLLPKASTHATALFPCWEVTHRYDLALSGWLCWAAHVSWVEALVIACGVFWNEHRCCVLT